MSFKQARFWPLFILGPVIGGILGLIPIFLIDFTGKKKEMIQSELRERWVLLEKEQGTTETVNEFN